MPIEQGATLHKIRKRERKRVGVREAPGRTNPIPILKGPSFLANVVRLTHAGFDSLEDGSIYKSRGYNLRGNPTYVVSASKF
jgi:hypothetical protein